MPPTLSPPPSRQESLAATAAAPLVVGAPELPAAVLAHGSGSTADFVARCFAEALQACGFRLVTWNQWDRGAERSLADLADLADRFDAGIVGGVSLGAHLAAALAATRRDVAPAGLWLVMPAWIGAPDGVAALSDHAADTIASDGLEGALGQVGDGALSWVHDELAAAWPAYGAARLVRALRDTARSPAPTRGDLARIRQPAGVVALDGDPFHPAAVASTWAEEMPRSCARTVAAAEPGTDRAILGREAAAAWAAAASPVSESR